jgi:hypothetical protein
MPEASVPDIATGTDVLDIEFIRTGPDASAVYASVGTSGKCIVLENG